MSAVLSRQSPCVHDAVYACSSASCALAFFLAPRDGSVTVEFPSRVERGKCLACAFGGQGRRTCIGMVKLESRACPDFLEAGLGMPGTQRQSAVLLHEHGNGRHHAVET